MRDRPTFIFFYFFNPREYPLSIIISLFLFFLLWFSDLFTSEWSSIGLLGNRGRAFIASLNKCQFVFHLDFPHRHSLGYRIKEKENYRLIGANHVYWNKQIKQTNIVSTSSLFDESKERKININECEDFFQVSVLG